MQQVAKSRPLLGITMGDPAGIGPEITVKALAKRQIYDICRPLVIGDYAAMKNASEKITSLNLRLKRLDNENLTGGQFECGTIDLLDLDNVDMAKLVHGEVSAMCGKACYEYIEKAISLALAGIIDGAVTGPIHKDALNKAGIHYAGHTEIYGELTNTADYAMMLVEGDFRVIHVSTHVSLREACDRVRKPRILAVIKLAQGALVSMGIENPRIAVAGLNPHASDNELFGSEEREHIAPAIEEARSLGINAKGPLPPDTCFSKTRGGQYDIAVAMYHDQGHIPLKVVGFVWDQSRDKWHSVSGVNVTLGLPIIRTSVDHGVAFGKAGKGTALPDSLLNAITLAAQLAGVKVLARSRTQKPGNKLG